MKINLTTPATILSVALTAEAAGEMHPFVRSPGDEVPLDVRIEDPTHGGNPSKFRLTNLTKFAADVSVLVENAKAAKQRVGPFVLKPLPVVHLDAGASTTLQNTAP
jgi:hypothetical protein